MENTKYGKYILTEPLQKANNEEIKVPAIEISKSLTLPDGWSGVPISITMSAVHSPFKMLDKGHVHDVDEILFFLGANPMDYRDFGAEAYILLGEEGEKHIINKTTFIYIPKGLLHCPIEFTRVDKPIVFGHVLLSPEYEKTE